MSREDIAGLSALDPRLDVVLIATLTELPRVAADQVTTDDASQVGDVQPQRRKTPADGMYLKLRLAHLHLRPKVPHAGHVPAPGADLLRDVVKFIQVVALHLDLNGVAEAASSGRRLGLHAWQRRQPGAYLIRHLFRRGTFGVVVHVEGHLRLVDGTAAHGARHRRDHVTNVLPLRQRVDVVLHLIDQVRRPGHGGVVVQRQGDAHCAVVHGRRELRPQKAAQFERAIRRQNRQKHGRQGEFHR